MESALNAIFHLFNGVVFFKILFVEVIGRRLLEIVKVCIHTE